MAYAGAEPPTAARHLFDVLATARDAAVTFCNERLAAGQPVYGYEVDDACREVIVAAGYGDAFIHRTGHSLGEAPDGITSTTWRRATAAV